MGKFDKIALLLSLIVITIWFPIVVECAKKAVGVARKEDIPYIRCQVCEKLAYQLYHHVQNKHAEISPKKVTFSFGVLFFQLNLCIVEVQSIITRIPIGCVGFLMVFYLIIHVGKIK